MTKDSLCKGRKGPRAAKVSQRAAVWPCLVHKDKNQARDSDFYRTLQILIATLKFTINRIFSFTDFDFIFRTTPWFWTSSTSSNFSNSFTCPTIRPTSATSSTASWTTTTIRRPRIRGCWSIGQSRRPRFTAWTRTFKETDLLTGTGQPGRARSSCTRRRGWPKSFIKTSNKDVAPSVRGPP